MNKNINRILEEKIKVNNLWKNEFIGILLKSIIQNNNSCYYIKNFSRFNLLKIRKYRNKISTKNKICLLSGKRKSTVNGFNFSRYQIKNLILANKLTNFKKNNW
jgi:ribosomal protein S14